MQLWTYMHSAALFIFMGPTETDKCNAGQPHSNECSHTEPTAPPLHSESRLLQSSSQEVRGDSGPMFY